MPTGVSATSADLVRPFFSRAGPGELARRSSASVSEGVSPAAGRAKNLGPEKLSEEDRQRLDELKKTDRQVRQHEQMHLAAGRELITSGPVFAYEEGPDGRSYAVSGEVGIDASKAATPEATVPKARHIRSTALAPPDPSAQDRQVAAMAALMEMAALQEIARSRQSEGGNPEVEVPRGNGAEAIGRGDHGMVAYRRMMARDEVQTMGMSAYA